MNKIKCLEPLLSTFEAVFPTRRQPTATLLLLSSPEQRWLSPCVSTEEPIESQNWPFAPAVQPITRASDAATTTHAAIETRQPTDETRFSERLPEDMPIRVAIVEDDRAVRE